MEPLQRGRTTAKDNDPVESVPADVIESTLPLLTQVQADMVRFQLLTGCRPGELVRLHPAIINRSGEVWFVELAKHKTARKGNRTI